MTIEIALGGRYDRVQALLDGRVLIRDTDAKITVFDRAPLAFKALVQSDRFDVGEMSFSFYTTMRSADRPSPFVGLPIFLSRMFRRGNILVRSDSELKTLADLDGKTIALAEYGMTMAVYIRGLLAEEYGIPPSSIEWRPTRNAIVEETQDLTSPPGVRIAADTSGSEPIDLLRQGAVDAAIAAPTLRSDPDLRVLAGNPLDADQAAYLRSPVFPIMHLLVVRREVLETEPQLAVWLYDAFCEARDVAIDQLRQTSVPYVSLPWLDAIVGDAWDRTGGELWPYGIEKNRLTLEAFLRYATGQYLLHQPISSIENLFPENMWST